jgi:hypothetical protein
MPKKVMIFDRKTGQFEIKKIDTLKDMQNIVGGLIQPVTIKDDDNGGIDIVGNEEGLLMDLPLTAMSEDKVIMLVGPLFFARVSYAQGEYINLTPQDIEWISKLPVRKMYFRKNNIMEENYVLIIPNPYGNY